MNLFRFIYTSLSDPMKPIKTIKGNINIPYTIDRKINCIIKNTNLLKRITIKKCTSYITIIIFIVISMVSNAQETIPNHTVSNQTGSTVICIAKNDTIWIGADSKLISGQTPISQVCKITQIGNFVFAHAGFFKSNTTNLNVDTIAAYTIRGSKNINDAFYRFSHYMLYSLEFLGIFPAVGHHYRMGDTIPDLGMETIIATFEKGEPWVLKITYTTIIKDTSFPDEMVCFHTKTTLKPEFMSFTNNVGYFSIGINDVVSPILDTYRFTNIPKAIDVLIKKEAEIHPFEIDTSVSIVRMTKNEVKWINKNQPCK